MSLEQDQRGAVVAEARSWIGTRYHHMGRIKKTRTQRGGTDCGQYIYMVFFRCGLISEMPLEAYPPDWHLHRDHERYMAHVTQHCREMDPAEPMLPGDLTVYQFGRVFAHGGIVSQWPTMIHAYKDAGEVQSSLVTAGRLSGRPQKHFSYWGR